MKHCDTIVECPDKNCYDHYRSTHYLPVVNQLEPGKSEKKKKNDPKVWYDVTNVPYTLVDGYRLVQDDISPTTLLVQYENGGDNGTVVGEQHRVGELNTVYTESPLLEGTRGVLGMAFSFFDCKFFIVHFSVFVLGVFETFAF